jgi:hypothetical protein
MLERLSHCLLFPPPQLLLAPLWQCLAPWHMQRQTCVLDLSWL